MPILSNKIEKEMLRPGDHIYSFAAATHSPRHGIYLSDVKVIHFTSSPGTARVSWPRCSVDRSRANVGVISSCLECFLSGGYPHLFEYSVSKPYFLAKVREGCCTMTSSDPLEDVRNRAQYLLQKGFRHNIFKNSPEAFALYCKTGFIVTSNTGGWGSEVIRSFLDARNVFIDAFKAITAAAKQVTPCIAGTKALEFSKCVIVRTSWFTGLPDLVAAAAGVYWISGTVVVLAVAGSIYCCVKISSDVGRRRDAIKVPVESLHTIAELNSRVV